MKKKNREYATKQLVIRASDSYRHWVRCLAADAGLSTSEFFEKCVSEYASRNSAKMPPRRWPPEVEE